MLKKIFTPVQTWLLLNKRCAGCGTPLAKGILRKKNKLAIVNCRCNRRYVFDEKRNAYRRALVQEE